MRRIAIVVMLLLAGCASGGGHKQPPPRKRPTPHGMAALVTNCYETNDCWPVYPPVALYDQWIPGVPDCYPPFNPTTKKQWTSGSCPNFVELSAALAALGYKRGDRIWYTPITTRQLPYIQFRGDGLPPPDLPPTGVPAHGMTAALYSWVVR